jgi:hypothetical protein
MKVMGKVLLASSLLMALGASAYAAGITWVKIPIAATSCTSVNTTSHASWTNNTGRALNVSRAYIWAGMD